MLFGLLGAFMLGAAFRPAWQAAALVAGLISLTSFLLLAALVGHVNPPLMRVVWIDLLLLPGLAAAGIVLVRQHA